MFILWLPILTSVVFLFIYNAIKKRLDLPVILFNVVWSVLFTKGLLNLQNIQIINFEKSYFILIFEVFLICFNLAQILFIKDNNNLLEKQSYKIVEGKYTIVLTCILVALLVLLRKSIGYILSGNFYAIRAAMYYEQVGQSNSLYSSGVETVLVQWVINGILIALAIIITNLNIQHKCSNKLFLYTIVVCTTFALLTAGRIMLLKLIIIFIISYLTNNIKFLMRYSKKNNQIYIRKYLTSTEIIFIVLFLLAIFITIGRNLSAGFNTASISETFINYLLSPIEYLLVLVDHALPFEQYFYGSVFFGGIFQIIEIILKNITTINFTFGFQQVIDETSQFLQLSDGSYYNAFPTAIYYFIRDGGLLGVAIDSFLFSFITAKLFNNKNKNLIFQGYYILGLFLIIYSVFRWEPMIAEFWFTVIAIPLLSSKYFNKPIK
ncbi:hypothetical protein HMPREF2829_06610 [Aerococcus sp. HMSC072A12]|uniref:O-antigen polymerase n=1 Tax=Aerococcus sp. HMSC072A12 TaxID=1739333 RepID=UPI0008A32E2D|nr:O-antigen polymerase [Aerococcus sp. HMSC072A12]OFK20974.1 hypothetical protein HMPREF2829_06610 [Aerococcus sp. HMSC072A12]